MSRITGKKGFTLVEVILVLLILAVIAGIVLPRITYNINEARGDACRANMARINAMAEYANARDGLAYPTTPALLAAFRVNALYFPNPIPANCPMGTAYASDATTGRMVDHGH